MADSDGFRNPALAVDAIAIRERADVVEVLLIRRGHPPYQGRLAFPGGFVDVGEDPEIAVLRELFEETGVLGSDPKLFAVRGDPGRDPRKHIVSIFYLVSVNLILFQRLETMHPMQNGLIYRRSRLRM